MNPGFIIITDEVYKQMWSTIYIFMRDFRPTHIEFRPLENNVWYMYGESDSFDPIKEGEAVPQYDVVFSVHPMSVLTYEFKRVL